MPVFKNISGYKIKVKNRILYPNQNIKLTPFEYEKYIYKKYLQILSTPTIKVDENKEDTISSNNPTNKVIKTLIEPQLDDLSTPTKSLSNNLSVTPTPIQFNDVDIVTALNNINETLNIIKDNMSNMQFQTNVISNHKEKSKSDISAKSSPKNVKSTSTADFTSLTSGDDLLANLLENSIR